MAMKIEVTPEVTVQRSDRYGSEAVLWEDRVIYVSGYSHHEAFMACIRDQPDRVDVDADEAYALVRSEGPLAHKVKHGWWDERWKAFYWNYSYTE